MIRLPGDEIQFNNGNLYINDKLVEREKVEIKEPIRCGNFTLKTDLYRNTSKWHQTFGNLQRRRYVKKYKKICRSR